MLIFDRYSLPTSKFSFLDEIRYVLTENRLGDWMRVRERERERERERLLPDKLLPTITFLR